MVIYMIMLCFYFVLSVYAIERLEIYLTKVIKK